MGELGREVAGESQGTFNLEVGEGHGKRGWIVSNVQDKMCEVARKRVDGLAEIFSQEEVGEGARKTIYVLVKEGAKD